MRINDDDPGISNNMGGITLDNMIMTLIAEIMTAIAILINNGLVHMNITNDVVLWNYVVWAIFMGLLLAILNRLIKAVNN